MRRDFLYLIAVTAGLLALLPTALQAQGGLPIQELNVKVQLQRNGTASVQQELIYPNPSPLNWRLLSTARQLHLRADERTAQYKATKRGRELILEGSELAKQWQIAYTATTNLIRHDNRDQFFFKVFQQPGVPINRLSVDFYLPAETTGEGLSGNAYAIGGVVDPKATVVAANHLRYEAGFAGGQSLFTVNASWPKSVLRLSLWQELRLSFLNLELIPWLILGFGLPLLSLVVLLRLVLKQRREDRLVVTEIRSQPPSQLSPILVGVLLQKKIYPQGIAALLIDFCQRGYAVIVTKNQEYFLGRRQPPDEKLASWEQKLLFELFPSVETAISNEQLRALNKRSLFSPRIRDAFGEIYQVITDNHFFAENPHLTRVRYKLLALTLYFTGLFGLIWMAVVGSSTYLIIPLGSTMIIAWLIMRLTPKLIHYTREGQAARRDWLAFANYLKLGEPLQPEAARNRTFERYLPYAAALNQTLAWAQRFDRSSSVIVRPDWFITYRETTVAEFAQEIVRFTNDLSKILAGMRGPLVS